LVDIDLPMPEATGRDILVTVKAVSVNPVDTKIRASTAPAEGEEWKVIGWDASGIVSAVGSDVERFKPGDEVFYAGSIVRSGANAEFHLVDERIVGRKPTGLDWAEAAAMPLTTLTAWEMLFDRLDVRRPVPGAAHAILIIGGAGGVGSIATQLARTQTDLTVIATASRQETVDWVRDMGAHHIINHSKPIAAQVAALGIGAPAYVFSTTQTNAHAAEIAELIAPQGRLGLIDDIENANRFKAKSVSIHWELMYTRSMFATADIDAQGKLLDQAASLLEDGKLKTTLTERLSPIDAATLKKAHEMSESGKMIGKVVVEGFGTERRT
jgi:NADPH2:quinone reductase